ncbi:MAG: hypothetical protein M0Z41_13865 [Peptococcaceae bacterium]|nr:hypothetical protein [Peptococcaceae bacterium]
MASNQATVFGAQEPVHKTGAYFRVALAVRPVNAAAAQVTNVVD